MKKYIKQLYVLLLVSSLMTAGCTDSFDEVNTDPAPPTTVAGTNF